MTTKRERPEDGGMVWHAHLNAFECLGCTEMMPQRRAVWNDPERLAETRELLIVDHTECWEYNDARMARLARRFRKELKRQQLLANGGRGLAAQQVSWRGRREQ